MTDDVELLQAALAEEQKCLWADFGEALNFSAVRQPNPANRHTGWSIQMLNLADRIVDIARLVGPTEWGAVSVRLLLDGWYAAVYDDAHVEYPEIDWDRVREVDETIRRTGKL